VAFEGANNGGVSLFLAY